MSDTLPLIISDMDPCRNKWGMVKLELVRNFFDTNVNSSTIPDLINLYLDWRNATELLPMRLKYKTTGFIDFNNTPIDKDKWISRYIETNRLFATPFNDNPNCNAVAYECYKYKWIVKKSVKRGNDVYVKMLKEKFKPFINSKNHKEFFSTVVNSKRKRVRKTQMLYISGTCNQKITGGIYNSWVAFGCYWNEYITRIRDIFGGSAYIRTWQSQENGYPHFHALIYFFDFDFTVFPRLEIEKGKEKIIWRIPNRQTVTVNKKTNETKPCINVLVDLWKWGNIDVRGCDNTKQALKDLLKYVLRDLEGGEAALTNTMVWYFKKKSFAVSKEFYKLFDANASLEPSDADLINAEGVTQEAVQEDKLISIDVFPILPRELMPFYSQLSLDNWETPPDPPPELVNFFDNFADTCKPVKVSCRSDGVVVSVYKLNEEGFNGPEKTTTTYYEHG